MLKYGIKIGWVLAVGFISPALAADFVSTKVAGVVLYDAPDLHSQKRFVLGVNYPLERITQDKTWFKVRDGAGALAWIEQKNTQNQPHMLQVIVPKAAIHQAADDASPVVFYAGQNVLLQAVEPARLGWVKVRHQDGSVGYMAIKQVWGL